MLTKQRRKVRFSIYHSPSSKHLQEHYFQNILERQYPPVFRLLKLTLVLHVPKPHYKWDDLWRQCCTSKKISRATNVGMLSLWGSNLNYRAKRSWCVCACTLPRNPAQPHLFQQFKKVKWTGQEQQAKDAPSTLLCPIGIVTAKQTPSGVDRSRSRDASGPSLYLTFQKLPILGSLNSCLFRF